MRNDWQLASLWAAVRRISTLPTDLGNGSHNLLASSTTGNCHRLLVALVVAAALYSASIPVAAQDAPAQHAAGVTIQGRVLNSAGVPVQNALVRLVREGVLASLETKTNAAGAFMFSAPGTGRYLLSAERSGLISRTIPLNISLPGEQKQIDVLLADAPVAHTDSGASSVPITQTMEFADTPNFTVAGVMDWTAAGGHGSDTSLRTSEALTRETLKLKANASRHDSAESTSSAGKADHSEDKLRAALAGAPASFEANRQLGDFYLHAGRYGEALPLLQTAYQIDPANRANEYQLALALRGKGSFSQAREHVEKLLEHGESADLHRVAGELDESTGDPLAAVHEYEQAVRMDESEENYFAWGSELLLHRAILQAQEVFQNGAKAYPKSVRMLTALGTALFAGAHYEEAAQRLCDASDLSPADLNPYIFMGRIEVVAPNPLPCVQQRLARFVDLQPGNSLANYYYAMAILKGYAQPLDQQVLQQVETLLNRALQIDAQCGEAYLQLGILKYSQRNFEKAIDDFNKAIAANPELVDAHYRLAVAYDRIGATAKAEQEFHLHDEMKKQQAAEVERQRRAVKQFLVGGQPTYPAAH
jgi:tetratricopeptide (TPR) repeat protein